VNRLAVVALLALAGCKGAGDGPKTPFEAFLRDYGTEVDPAWSKWQAANWKTHTQVVPGDPTLAQQAVAAYEGWREKAADPKWVRQSRDLLKEGNGAAPSTAEKAALDAVARTARKFPATDRALLDKIDEKVGLQTRFRLRAEPKLDGEAIHPDELARRYAAAVDTAERKALWKAMLGPAGDLKPSYAELRDLRNELARKGGWQNWMDAELDPYGMSSSEMVDFMGEVELVLRPLYQELHTWAREELANRYLVTPPELIPVHWLPAPAGEDWSGLVALDHGDLEPALQAMGAKQMLKQVEDWYVAGGLAPLPETFWTQSSLFPVPPGSHVGKTQGASTWDLDLNGDVRVLMSARPTASWRGAAFREFGFAHAYRVRQEAGLYAPIRQQQPRALLDALGIWADLAASRPQALVKAKLLDQPPEPMLELLHEALLYVPFVEFGAGTVVPFEYEVYAESLAPGQMNSRWWGLLARHQGVFPPETRTERWADFLSVDTLADTPGRYSDHVLAVLLAFQLQDALAKEAKADPRTTDLGGNPRFGEMFQALAAGEGVEEWRGLVSKVTGAPPSAEPMVRYFQPLLDWLKEQNASRTSTLPSLR
jgi:peptidyl-dipeptidase A